MMDKLLHNCLVDMFEDIKEMKTFLPAQARKDDFTKSFFLACLIDQYGLVDYAELNGEIGYEFLGAAYSSSKQNGRVSFINSRQENVLSPVDKDTDLVLSCEVVEKIFSEHSFFESVSLIWYSVKEQAAVCQDVPKFDILNISKNNKHIEDAYVDNLLLAVKETGLVVFDTALASEIHASIKRLGRNYAALYLNKTISVIRLGFDQENISVLETGRLDILYSLAENMEYRMEKLALASQFPLISVIVISYNQEKFIAECLQGIFAQKGNFNVELIISDDASQDTTREIIQDYVKSFGELITVKIISPDHNVGMTRNFQRSLTACTGDFIAVCEGDDYWLNPWKLQKQVRFLQDNPDHAICFNRIYMRVQDTEEFSVYEPNTKFDGNVFDTRDLVKEYFIDNLSCCMYVARHKEKINEDIFDLYIAEWMFNIYYSQFGRVGCVEEFMSVYRKYDDDIWFTADSHKNVKKLYGYLTIYDKYIDYELNKDLFEIQRFLKLSVANDAADLVILDDVAPHPLSAFRFQEFLSYVGEFENSVLYCSGNSVNFWGNKTLDELIYNFLRKYPKHAGQIDLLKLDTVIHAKLAYMVFLGNAYLNVDKLEQTGTPFIFCLYPGGSFSLHNERSDEMLNRVTTSPCFRKVIVTQKITYDYLIEKKFCLPDQIEFIFGVVTPLERFDQLYEEKRHFGINKNDLDICFTAHKYTETGVDKGYDVFVQVATVLAEKYPNIRFHVVGGFDENVLDVSQIKDKITFYGPHETDWFDGFYLDKDIILSPNIPFKIFEGSFDGFPTGSCTDAGLRETAIFCTDELKLNQGFFEDGQEIVIIPYDVMKIVNKIEYYYSNPEKLLAIGQCGRQKIMNLYGYEAQIAPRIKLLQDEIDAFEKNKKEMINKKFDMFEEDMSYLGWLQKK